MSLRPTGALVRQLGIFVAVVENGGFSNAQAALYTSAASISVQIKELESQLGMTLCQRGRTGFKLTERGQAVYESAKTFFAAFENLNLSIANIRNELVGDIRIGIQHNIATNSRCPLPRALTRFNQRKNKVVFYLEASLASEQESRTLEGRYHLCVGIFIHRIPGLAYKKLFQEEVKLYCAMGHPLYDMPGEKVTISQIDKSKFVSIGPIEKALTHCYSFTQQPAAVTENMDATALMLLSGEYIGFLPTHYAEQWVERGLMKPLLEQKLTVTVDFHMITKKGEPQPYVVDVFINDLLEFCS